MNNELTAKEEDFLLEEARELGSLKKEVESTVKLETATLELKTLKDIEFFAKIDYLITGKDGNPKYEREECQAVKINELKAEAIKWVKELNKCNVCYGNHPFFGKIENNGDSQLILIKFFNLTEEELK